MKRKDALAYIKVAGFHNDSKTFTRLYVENRIAYSGAVKEWRDGAAMRGKVRCDCHECKEVAA